MIIKFYELLAYCLYYKNLDILSYENSVVFQELQEQVQQLGKEYSELLSQNKIYEEPYKDNSLINDYMRNKLFIEKVWLK